MKTFSFSLFRHFALVQTLAFSLFMTACATSEPSNTKAAPKVKSTQSTGFSHTQHYNANALLKNQYTHDRALYRQAKYQASYAVRMSNSYPLKNYIVYERLQLLPYLSEGDVKTFLMAEKKHLYRKTNS